MAAKVGLSVEVQGDDIVVTLPGTSYVVTYYSFWQRASAIVPNYFLEQPRKPKVRGCRIS